MIALIAAVAKNGIIGSKNKLPWYIPEDLKRFKDLTNGKTVLMGSRTYESIVGYLGKPLPNRTNIVLAGDANITFPEGVFVYKSIPEALAAHKDKDIFVIGGGMVYKQMIDLADTLYITHVDKEVEGDVSFPAIDPERWNKVSDEPHEGFSFAVYKKA
jgi:dihydrofolate reductase